MIKETLFVVGVLFGLWPSAAAFSQVVTDELELLGIWKLMNDRRLVGNWMIEAGNYTVLDMRVSRHLHLEKHFYTLQSDGCTPLLGPNGLVYSGDDWSVRTRYLDDTVDLHLPPDWFYGETIAIVEFEPDEYIRMDDGSVWEYVGRELVEDGCNVFTGHPDRDPRGPDGNIYLPGLWSKSFYLVELRPDGQVRLINHKSCVLQATGTWTVEGDHFSSRMPGGIFTYEFKTHRNDIWGFDLLLMGSDWSPDPPFEGLWTLRNRQFGAYPCGTPTLD